MIIDASVQQAITDAEMEAEIERLLKNRPMYAGVVPGTEKQVEEGQARAITSTAAELTLYNVETGEPSQVIFDALKARAKQRFPADHPNPRFAGKRVYTLLQEEAPQAVRGNLSCPLYYAKPSPDAIELGFGGKLCKKPPYFFTDYDVELHVEKNHARYAELKRRRKEERERQETRDQQAALTAAMIQLSQMRVAQEAPSEAASEPEVEKQSWVPRGVGRPRKDK